MFWGNIIGIAICFLQKKFGLIGLNPESYFINKIPINFNAWYVLAINGGTLLICTLMLLLPSYIITRISPVKAIRFR